MGSIQGSLNCSQSSRCIYSRTVTEFLGQVSMIDNVSEKLRNLDGYIKRLEAEMRKIDGLKRELPLCMFLLNDAIEAVKEETLQCRKLNGEPVLEEFIQLKNCTDGGGDDKNVVVSEESKESEEKMNWLSSAQLWTSSSELHSANIHFKGNKQSLKPDTEKRSDIDVNHVVSNDPMKTCKSQAVGHAFVPFKSYTSIPFIEVRNKEENSPGIPALSLQIPGMTNLRDDILANYVSSKIGPCRNGSSTSDGQCRSSSGPQSQQQQESNRKQRRCWSPELHRKFVAALQQLGGSQGATPKQIRELMQVEGLTNDEVKSHLQKYRLHKRRSPVTSVSTPNRSDASGNLCPGLDMLEKPSKGRNLQSVSPQGPLHYGFTSRGTSMTGGNSMEDKDDEKSESHSWKGHVQSLEKITV